MMPDVASYHVRHRVSNPAPKLIDNRISRAKLLWKGPMTCHCGGELWETAGYKHCNNMKRQKTRNIFNLVQEMNQKQNISFCHDVGCSSVQ